ncbi:MAG TPA: hypothetical protein VGD99_04275 [Anaerolineae bacterium]
MRILESGDFFDQAQLRRCLGYEAIKIIRVVEETNVQPLAIIGMKQVMAKLPPQKRPAKAKLNGIWQRDQHLAAGLDGASRLAQGMGRVEDVFQKPLGFSKSKALSPRS